MKKVLFVAIVAAILSSCGATAPKPVAKLVSSATHRQMTISGLYVTPLVADLEVSPEKIFFFYIPSKTVVAGGYDNVVDTAVREALTSNGNADMLVALETQVKYNAQGEPESITVTGYPAKYVNFRSVEDYKAPAAAEPQQSETKGGKGVFKLGF